MPKKVILLLSLIGIVIFAGLLLVSVAINENPQEFDPPTGSPPMITVYFDPCDIDRDGDCDADDFELFINALGQCEDADNYNEVADADHDGCVTVSDKERLFPVAPHKDR